MYEPVFNSLLVLIDDKDAQWGSGNVEDTLGKSYTKGQLITYGQVITTQAFPLDGPDKVRVEDLLKKLKGRNIQWNEGTEAGTTFEFDGKLFGFIYWWDLRAVKVEADAAKTA